MATIGGLHRIRIPVVNLNVLQDVGLPAKGPDAITELEPMPHTVQQKLHRMPARAMTTKRWTGRVYAFPHRITAVFQGRE